MIRLAVAVCACVIAAAGTLVVIGRAAAERALWRHPPVVVESAFMMQPLVVRNAPPGTRRAALARARDGEPVPVELTAYCLSGTTRRGRWVRPGIIAADPRIFPLSRFVELFVGRRYLGRFLVDDTGRLIQGAKIDVWLPSCNEARVFGRVQGTAVLVPRRKG